MDSEDCFVKEARERVKFVPTKGLETRSEHQRRKQKKTKEEEKRRIQRRLKRLGLYIYLLFKTNLSYPNSKSCVLRSTNLCNETEFLSPEKYYYIENIFDYM